MAWQPWKSLSPKNSRKPPTGATIPPVNIEEQEFDLLAFELWHLGSCPDLTDIEEWPDEQGTVASRASCL